MAGILADVVDVLAAGDELRRVSFARSDNGQAAQLTTMFSMAWRLSRLCVSADTGAGAGLAMMEENWWVRVVMATRMVMGDGGCRSKWAVQ